MKQFKDLAGNTISNDMYVKLDTIHKPRVFVKETNELDFVCSNTSLTFSDFMNKLILHERKHNQTKNKNYNYRYGVVLTILLDEYHSKNDLIKLSQHVAENYDNLPFFSFYKKQGDGHYLVIYFSERHFYQEGIPPIYMKDVYRDKITGRLCSSDTPTAVLVHKKGDIKENAPLIYFSFKVDTFKFNGKKHFNSYILKLRDWFIDLFNRLFSMMIEETITFGKYVLNSLSNTQKQGASIWNKTIKELEKFFADIYEGMILMKLVDEKSMRIFLEYYRKYLSIIKRRSFRLYSSSGNRYFKVPVDFYDTTACDDLISICKKDVHTALGKIMSL